MPDEPGHGARAFLRADAAQVEAGHGDLSGVGRQHAVRTAAGNWNCVSDP